MATTRVNHRLALAIMGAAVLVSLVGCGIVPDAEPSSSPSDSASVSLEPEPDASPTARPALSELVLSAAGLGPLLLGQAPETDPALSMITYNPTACTDAETGEPFGIMPGDPLAALWETDPSYATTSAIYGNGMAFGVAIDEAAGNAVVRIDLFSHDIPTDEGVRIGDARADVVAAYPAAAVVTSFLTDIYVVTGPTGLLQIEVATEPEPGDAGYWEGREGQVVYIHAVSASFGVFSVAASGNIVGICNVG